MIYYKTRRLQIETEPCVSIQMEAQVQANTHKSLPRTKSILRKQKLKLFHTNTRKKLKSATRLCQNMTNDTICQVLVNILTKNMNKKFSKKSQTEYILFKKTRWLRDQSNQTMVESKSKKGPMFTFSSKAIKLKQCNAVFYTMTTKLHSHNAVSAAKIAALQSTFLPNFRCTASISKWLTDVMTADRQRNHNQHSSRVNCAQQC